MTKYLPPVLVSAITLAACSGETSRSEEASEEVSVEDSDAEDGSAVDTADASAPMSDADRETLGALEDNLRNTYAENHFEVRRYGVQPVGGNRYEGRVGLYDPLLDRESEVDCFMVVAGSRVSEGDCTEVDPAAQRNVTTRGDVVIRANDRGGMREEIVREMQYNVAGQGRTSTPLRFSGEFPDFVSLYRTTAADGSSWQSGCAGRIEEGENGAQVAQYVCRQRP